MDNKEKILETLYNRPMTFTELKKEIGLENGVLQHHLHSIEKIRKKSDGTFMHKDECQKCDLEKICKHKCMRNKLRKGKKLEITKLLQKDLQQKDIAEELELSRPTINHHVQDLRDSNIINGNTVRKEVKYFLQE